MRRRWRCNLRAPFPRRGRRGTAPTSASGRGRAHRRRGVVALHPSEWWRQLTNSDKNDASMRLVTRADLDGLTSAVIITMKEPIDELLLVHPQEITDKRVEIRGDDILANLPYHPNAAKWFDPHLLTDSNEKPPAQFEGRYRVAPSAARLVYEYYTEKYPDDAALQRLAQLVDETDRLDAAQLTPDDVESPQGYILLGYTIDSRTGLGNFEEYFRQLVAWLRTSTIEEILEQPEVKRRVARIRNEQEVRRPRHRQRRRLPRGGAPRCAGRQPLSRLLALPRRERVAARALGAVARHGRRRGRALDLQPDWHAVGGGAHVALRRRRPSGRGDVHPADRQSSRGDRRDLVRATSKRLAIRAGDEPRAALKRHVRPRPLQQNEQPVPEADQIEDVDAEPGHPGHEAAEVEPRD